MLSSSTMSSNVYKLLLLFLFHIWLSTIRVTLSLPCQLPPEISSLYSEDPSITGSTAVDFGNIIHNKPLGVFFPKTEKDIAALVKTSYSCKTPFTIGVRGHGHSTHGQDMARNGVVIDMKSLRANGESKSVITGRYAEAGGEQLWLDVMKDTLSKKVSPLSWTDYLNLTVGGTLSNAGISGQSFRFGPQISNVLEMNVVTGKGDLLTCSPKQNSELFFGVLGGLGQFGIITKAKISINSAPKRVRWAQILYSDFTAFTQAQEKFIANNDRNSGNGVSYLEGGILLDNGTPNLWRTSFFPPSQVPKITALTRKYGVIYSIEVATNYNGKISKKVINMKMNQLYQMLEVRPHLIFQKDVSYEEFLTRVPSTEPSSLAHPWLNFFIPKSGIPAFMSGVVRGILLKRNITFGPVLFYPMNKNKWDDRTSAVVPNEDIFYAFGLLCETGAHSLQEYKDQNQAILNFFSKARINAKQYLGNQPNKVGWIEHFGPKWKTFQQRKALFDPKNILTPGQKIFN